MQGLRLSKRVAALAGCSRSEAERLIEGGWVRVDGEVVEQPMARVLSQTVEVDPHAKPMALLDVTLLLHKPPGYDALTPLPGGRQKIRSAQALLEADKHWAQDEVRQRLLQRHFRDLVAVTPLETAASGLVVFTQDERVRRKLRDDAAATEHEYLVEVQGSLDSEALLGLNHPRVTGRLPVFKFSLNSTQAALTRLRCVVKGEHPGLLAELCDLAGLRIEAIKRLRIGRVALNHLPMGQWRYLAVHERF